MSIYVILKLSVTIYSNHLLTFVNCKYTKNVHVSPHSA